MKLFWKLFCSMVSVTILACSTGGFVLIDSQFRASLDQEVQSLYEENDMLRYVLLQTAEGEVLTGREELSRLADSIALQVAFRLSDSGGRNLGSSDVLGVEAAPLTGPLAENQRGWVLERDTGGAAVLHGASAFTLLDETVYLENCRDVTTLFIQRDVQYRSFFWVMLALIAGVAVLSLAVSHLICAPLTRVSAAARRLADGELSQRVPVSSGDELGQLSADFNAMAVRLGEQMEELTRAAQRQKDFTGSFARQI